MPIKFCSEAYFCRLEISDSGLTEDLSEDLCWGFLCPEKIHRPQPGLSPHYVGCRLGRELFTLPICRITCCAPWLWRGLCQGEEAGRDQQKREVFLMRGIIVLDAILSRQIIKWDATTVYCLLTNDASEEHFVRIPACSSLSHNSATRSDINVGSLSQIWLMIAVFFFIHFFREFTFH